MNVFELFGSEKPRKNLKESSEITIVYESSDMCKVCGQTPCNCTNISESTVNEFAIDKNDAGDGRSKLIGAIAQLLQANKKVDFYVPGIRGHVSGIGGQGDWVTLKRWNKPHSKINYSLDLDSSDDDRFALKMIRPDYYQVVEKNELGEGIGSDTAKLLGIPVVAGALAVGAQHYDDQQPHVQVGGQNAKIVQYGSSRIPSNAMVLKGADGKMYRVWQQSGKGMNKMTLAAPAEQVKEGTVDRRIARTQALIQDYHKRAKASANDIKKNHYLAMADQLTAELQSLIDDANEHERASNEIAQHDAESSRVWESYDDYDDSWDYRDEIASLENQIKYSKSSALTHTLYKQLDQLKREHGVEIDDDEYYGDFDDEGHRIDDEGNRIDNFGNIIEQDVEEARRANTAAARAELGNRPRKPGLSPAEQDKAKADSDEAWERLMAYADEQKKKEQGLNEFAPGNGGGESGRWYTDDDMTNIVGDGWWQDLDISGDVSKQEMINEAQAWLLDNGYRVQVLNVKVNDDDCEWFIEGSFQNNRFAKKGMAESQLNEYLVKAGMPVEDVLTLNLFQDFDPEEGCAAQFPEFAASKQWQQVVRKYSRIADALEKQILALNQPLTHSAAEEIENVWYDGSDAYDDMEIAYLVGVYNRQIAVVEAIIAGELQDDDEEFGEGVAKGSDDYVDPEEADYGDEYQAMVKRVGQKAKQQELAKKHSDEDLTESFLYAMKKAGYDII